MNGVEGACGLCCGGGSAGKLASAVRWAPAETAWSSACRLRRTRCVCFAISFRVVNVEDNDKDGFVMEGVDG